VTWRKLSGVRRSTSACGAGWAPIKPASGHSERLMAGIGVIILFLLAIGVLNRVEFGRFD
jgi:hypothetical protein